MNTRAFAIVGAIAAVSLARGVDHVDKKSVDKNSADTHRDR
jgi:hypothetical protein